MTNEEYEERLDALKGEARFIVEDLLNQMPVDGDPYDYADVTWCHVMVVTLRAIACELEDLKDEFEWLEKDRRADEEDEGDEEEDEE